MSPLPRTLLVVGFLCWIVGCNNSSSQPQPQPQSTGRLGQVSQAAAVTSQQPATQSTTPRVVAQADVGSQDTSGGSADMADDPEEPEDEGSFDLPDFNFEGGVGFGASSEPTGGFGSGGGGGQVTFSDPDYRREGLGQDKAAKMVAGLIADAVDYGPTLAVWIVDRSASAQGLVSQVARTVQQPVATLAQGTEKEDHFLTAMVAFGGSVEFVLDPPSSDASAISNAFASIGSDPTGKEMVFTAISQSIDKYLDYRTKQRREVIFIVITDEAGDDQNMVEDVLQKPKRYGIPIYVIGAPAPFGRPAALAASVEGGSAEGSSTLIQQGPESRYSERLNVGMWGGMNDMYLVDSGFGPFALEWLCRASEGRYLAIRPSATGFFGMSGGPATTEWPSKSAWQPQPTAMRKYAPDFVSDAEYKKLLQANAACQALHLASQMPMFPSVALTQTRFEQGTQAEMARMLSQAQQAPAKLAQPINELYDLLSRGEKDREKLTSPRWQASYDLAMGRVTAMKSRVDSYNNLLAALKRGMTFENAGSTAWVLEATEKTEATSALRKLSERALMYLNRVVDEHPGTPWAALAKRELSQPVGWKWTER